MPPPQGTFNPIEGPRDYTMTREVHSDTYDAISPRHADLHGRAVFITGASYGIGRSIAISYAVAGASMLALGARSDLSTTVGALRAAAQEAGRAPPRVLALQLDVSDEASVRKATEAIEVEFGGKLDIVINNAGVLNERRPIAETDVDAWQQHLDVNVRGVYLITRACLPLLLKGGLKIIATVASVTAITVSIYLSGYQISKLAAVRLMESVAKEYTEQGIMAFSVHPGNVITKIVNNGEGMDPKIRKIFTETPELCADSLVYLTTENRPWLSGRYINVFWDLPELTSEPKKTEIIEGDKLKVRLAV